MPLGAFKAALMGTAGVSAEDLVLLSSQTDTGVSEIDFTSGITSTYKEYIFKFYNINPADDNVSLTFQCNATDGADYDDESITGTFFDVQHSEADAVVGPSYRTDKDHNGTGFHFITNEQGNGSDESGVAEMHLFNPASTTYVKNFYIVSQIYRQDDKSCNYYIAGYINTATAIDDIRFKFTAGDFDGTIKMWGVKS